MPIALARLRWNQFIMAALIGTPIPRLWPSAAIMLAA